MVLESALGWYQSRISQYDKQSWETTVEQRILQGLSYTPRKTANPKTEFIDVDLVRGSTFPKAKPHSGLWLAGLHGITRIILLPLYYHWWILETSCMGFLIVLSIYCSIIFCGAIMITCRHTDYFIKEVPVSEVLLLGLVMVVLSIIHSQIVCTRHPGGSPMSSSPLHRPTTTTTSSTLGLRCGPGGRRATPASTRALRRTSTLSGRGKCCCTCKKDSVKQNNYTKKLNNSLKNRSPYKAFRSHSEEPRCEESYPLRPRSASENSIIASKINDGPSIIILHPINSEEKTEERSSSSATPSSGDPSPVIGHMQGMFVDELDHKKQELDATNTSNSEPEDITMVLSPSDLSGNDCNDYEKEIEHTDNRRIEEINNRNLEDPKKLLTEIIENENDDKRIEEINKRNLEDPKERLAEIIEKKKRIEEINIHSQETRNKLNNNKQIAETKGIKLSVPRQQRRLKMHDRRSECGSDGGEESCLGDIEAPTTDTDSCSINRSIRKGHRCPCTKTKLLDPHHNLSRHHNHHHSSPQLLPSVVLERSSCNSSCESDVDQDLGPCFSKTKPVEYEWTGITTNTDDLSYSSESEGGWDDHEDTHQTYLCSETLDWNIQGSPAAIITSTPNVSAKVSCKIWEGVEVKKVDLSVLDISSAVISKVDSLQHTTHYLQFGLTMATVIALVPSIYRVNFGAVGVLLETLVTTGPQDWIHALSNTTMSLYGLLGSNVWITTVIILSCLNRFLLAGGFFFLLSVAERTFKQRFLYAKHFCYLTSARRARKYDLPHFRLNKVHNIKTWLSVRSCLRKRGPQRSVDVIVSATFVITLLLVCYLCFELLKEDEKTQHSLYNCELFVWCFAIGIYLIRFMTLGAMINKKYSSLSVLITEQINMYLHMEQKPQKKDELTLANNVLKLVSVLLKELESPFKISGISANPLLYNITRLVVLSACSGVLSDLLGFKLKLHKIKL